MATTTPNYALRKPATTGGVSGFGDPVDVIADIGNNMDIIDAAIKALADKFGVSVDDPQGTAGTTTSTSFVETLTTGTPCRLTFTAPASGAVAVSNNCHIDNSIGTARSICSWILRTGAVIGSGSTIFDAGDADGISVFGTDEAHIGNLRKVSGLTPGASYNVRQQFMVNTASTGTFVNKYLLIIPLLGG